MLGNSLRAVAVVNSFKPDSLIQARERRASEEQEGMFLMSPSLEPIFAIRAIFSFLQRGARPPERGREREREPGPSPLPPSLSVCLSLRGSSDDRTQRRSGPPPPSTAATPAIDKSKCTSEGGVTCTREREGGKDAVVSVQARSRSIRMRRQRRATRQRHIHCLVQ